MYPFSASRRAVVVVLCLSLGLGSCATIFKGSNETVDFSSEPPAADIYINGQYMGKAPMQIELKASKSYTVEFRKDGYESKTVMLNNSVGAGWIVLDVIFGLIPVVIDAATGAWYTFDMDHVRGALVAKP